MRGPKSFSIRRLCRLGDLLEMTAQELREKCGVVGICSISREGVAEPLFKALYSLQHRGQEAAGVAVLEDKGLRVHKGLGLVVNVLTSDVLSSFRGCVGVGHVRYSTTPGVTVEDAQPFAVKNPKFSFALAFNGTITNFLELKEDLSRRGVVFTTKTDTEVLAKLLAKNLVECGMDYVEAFKLTASEVDGAC